LPTEVMSKWKRIGVILPWDRSKRQAACTRKPFSPGGWGPSHPCIVPAAARGHPLLEIDLGAVAHRAMWGYGVDPPSDTNHNHNPMGAGWKVTLSPGSIP
jgi:hypothetical protein